MRAAEHQRLFREGSEAELFDSFDELLAKRRHYLANQDERKRIAAAGLGRYIEGGYSNERRLAVVLDHFERVRRGARR